MANAHEYMAEIVKSLVEQLCQARADTDNLREEILTLKKDSDGRSK